MSTASILLSYSPCDFSFSFGNAAVSVVQRTNYTLLMHINSYIHHCIINTCQLVGLFGQCSSSTARPIFGHSLLHSFSCFSCYQLYRRPRLPATRLFHALQQKGKLNQVWATECDSCDALYSNYLTFCWTIAVELPYRQRLSMSKTCFKNWTKLTAN